MALDVTLTLKELLAENRGPNPLDPETRQPPNYGVVASLEGNILAVVLTFRKDCTYCCMQWGCHLPLIDGKRWDPLRRALSASGIAVPPKLEFRLSCVIEDVALFFDW